MLRLSREADYGLLAMIYIASQPEGALAYRRDMASHYNIPADFLAKVLQKLSRHGVIQSFRGTQGGYRLAREAETITLADLVEAIDGPMTLVDCQRDGCACPQEEVCTAQATLVDIQQGIRGLLAAVSLGDIRRRLKKEQEPRLIALASMRTARGRR